MEFQGYPVLPDDKIYSVAHGRYLPIVLLDEPLQRIRLDAGKEGVITIHTSGSDLSKAKFGPLFFWHKPPTCVPPKDATLADKVNSATEALHSILVR